MTTPEHPIESPVAHEPEEVSIRWMASIGLGLLAVVVGAAFGIAFAFQALVSYSPQFTAGQEAKRQLMVPGVQANQAYDREIIAEKERALLSHYHWQDTEHRLARIPIDRAIEIMAKRKLQTHWSVSDDTQSENVQANSREEEQP